MTEYIMVMVGGAGGAVCRFAVSSVIKKRLSAEFPVSTLLVNMAGSLLLGILMAVHPGELGRLLLGTGFMGGFTTFSTFQFENVSLLQKKKYIALLLYISCSIILCIALAAAGLQLGVYLRQV